MGGPGTPKRGPGGPEEEREEKKEKKKKEENRRKKNRSILIDHLSYIRRGVISHGNAAEKAQRVAL